MLSIQLPPPTLYDCCVPPPSNPSLCCTASVLGELYTVPVESPVSVHYLISGGIDCGDSLIHIHILYKHDWSSVEHWKGRGGMLRKDLRTNCTTDYRPSSGIRTVCARRNKTLFDKDVTRSNLSLEPAAEHWTLSAIWERLGAPL